jgi:cytidylate kinase-like protein
MPREPIQIVTLSREYGAGGSQLGLLLGSALAWPVLDRDLAERLAKRLRCKSADVEEHHERAPRFLERIAAAFTVVPSDAPILPELSRAPNPDTLFEATRAVLLEAVRTPPLIVIGHGANCLLSDRRDVLRVRVAAPYPVRVRRVARRTGQSVDEAGVDVRQRDADRRQYLERYYQKEVNDPCLYDLQINTATITLDVAAQMVVRLVRPDGVAA